MTMLRADWDRASAHDQPRVTARLRLQLTLVFGVAMAAVLIGCGVFVYLRVSSELLAAVDRDLGARSDSLVGTLARDPQALLAATHRFVDPDEAFAQVLDSSGRVVDATPGGSPEALLQPDEIKGLEAPEFLTRAATADADPQRLLAVRTSVQGAERIVVVGATLGDRQDALAQLLRSLTMGGIAATTLASLGAWLLAGAALAPVEAAVRRERRLVDDASHELRTPLSVVKAELDLALSRPRNAAELRRTVQAASHETDRLVRLTEDLLVLARQGQGDLPMRPSPTSLRAVVDSAVAGVGEPPAGRPLAIRVEDTVVQLDPERMRQVIVNLVDNAFKHGCGEVTLEVRAARNTLYLDVADQGEGLPESLQDNAFEPFRRAVALDGAPGAGLGLAIVKAITTALGGRVEAYREHERSGVRVAIPLPVHGRSGSTIETRPARPRRRR
jgi:two-component system, OmpR family, sensor kinase